MAERPWVVNYTQWISRIFDTLESSFSIFLVFCQSGVAFITSHNFYFLTFIHCWRTSSAVLYNAQWVEICSHCFISNRLCAATTSPRFCHPLLSKERNSWHRTESCNVSAETSVLKNMRKYKHKRKLSHSHAHFGLRFTVGVDFHLFAVGSRLLNDSTNWIRFRVKCYFLLLLIFDDKNHSENEWKPKSIEICVDESFPQVRVFTLSLEMQSLIFLVCRSTQFLQQMQRDDSSIDKLSWSRSTYSLNNSEKKCSSRINDDRII